MAIPEMAKASTMLGFVNMKGTQAISPPRFAALSAAPKRMPIVYSSDPYQMTLSSPVGAPSPNAWGAHENSG